MVLGLVSTEREWRQYHKKLKSKCTKVMCARLFRLCSAYKLYLPVVIEVSLLHQHPGSHYPKRNEAYGMDIKSTNLLAYVACPAASVRVVCKTYLPTFPYHRSCLFCADVLPSSISKSEHSCYMEIETPSGVKHAVCCRVSIRPVYKRPPFEDYWSIPSAPTPRF